MVIWAAPLFTNRWHHGSNHYSRTHTQCQARKRILCVINCVIAGLRHVLPRLTSLGATPT